MKKTFLTGLLLAAISFTSCDEDEVVATSTFTVVVDNLQGEIKDGTVTLDASQTYTLTGALIVRSGATLNIQAGTRIEAVGVDPNTLYIAVERGAKIYIKGEENKAVVMTSGKSTPAQSDWGGLIICGDGKVNTGDNGTSEVGGLAYGGNNNADSSGEISYLRIEYTGSKFTSDKEYNGVSFFGVGSGTKVSHIYAYESGDDGIEFFGGAVNATNLAIVNAYDDSLDFADGYVGTIENIYISGVSKAGIEGSNNGANDVATPLTSATLKNVSIVKGTDAKFTASEQAINFKEGGGKQTYTNLYVSGITTFAKLDSGTGATARIAAGDFTVNGITFVSANNTTSTYVTTQTGAGNGATEPTWATNIK